MTTVSDPKPADMVNSVAKGLALEPCADPSPKVPSNVFAVCPNVLCKVFINQFCICAEGYCLVSGLEFFKPSPSTACFFDFN